MKIETAYAEYCRVNSNKQVVYEYFEAGFSAKERVIQETLQTMESLKEDINSLPSLEQLFKSKDLDRINNKIEVLQSLL